MTPRFSRRRGRPGETFPTHQTKFTVGDGIDPSASIRDTWNGSSANVFQMFLRMLGWTEWPIKRDEFDKLTLFLHGKRFAASILTRK